MHKSRSQHTSPFDAALAVTVAFMLVFAPLFKAGNRPLPLMVLELGAVVLIGLRFWPSAPNAQRVTAGTLWAAAGALLLYPLLYLIPVPFDVWAHLPGRSLYADALMLVDRSSAPDARPVTIVAASTRASWLALLPPLALFFGAVSLPTRLLTRLTLIALLMAVAQAMLGLMQFVNGDPDSALCLGNSYCGKGGATGSYVNRDHLAGLLEMMLPVALGLLAVTVGRLRHKNRYYRRDWRERVLSLSSWQANAAFLYAAAAIVMVLGLVFTRSRTGVGLAMACLLLGVIAFGRRIGGDDRFGPVGTVSAIAIALAIDIGLAPVFARFADNPLEDGRWEVFTIALQGIGSYFPLGSGPGTFSRAVLPFQPVEMGSLFFNHVHNDYLEWIFEGGLLSATVILLIIALYCRRWFSLPGAGTHWSTYRFIQVGAGIGLLLIALHGAVDFNWHIPANAVYTAFLAALFFHQPDSRALHTPEPEPARQAVPFESLSETPPSRPAAPAQPVHEPVNPFLE